MFHFNFKKKRAANIFQPRTSETMGSAINTPLLGVSKSFQFWGDPYPKKKKKLYVILTYEFQVMLIFLKPWLQPASISLPDHFKIHFGDSQATKFFVGLNWRNALSGSAKSFLKSLGIKTSRKRGGRLWKLNDHCYLKTIIQDIKLAFGIQFWRLVFVFLPVVFNVLKLRFIETLESLQHTDPNAWWMSQIVKYFFRLKPWVLDEISNAKEVINVTHPIVGYDTKKHPSYFDATVLFARRNSLYDCDVLVFGLLEFLCVYWEIRHSTANRIYIIQDLATGGPGAKL